MTGLKERSITENVGKKCQGCKYLCTWLLGRASAVFDISGGLRRVLQRVMAQRPRLLRISCNKSRCWQRKIPYYTARDLDQEVDPDPFSKT